MKIKTEFVIDNLEYSYTLPKLYTWNQLKKREFTFKNRWRVPYLHELVKLFDNVESSRGSAYLWSADDAWVLDFVNGVPYNVANNRNSPYSVRLVRYINND